MTWRESLRADPIPWLLEEENPSVRYGTLRDLLDRPAGGPAVLAARAAIPTWPPLAELLAAQKRDGYWVKRDFYLPKHYGTFWTLSVLADLGLTRDDERIEKACEFMFTFQRETGAFCRRRRVAGRGIVWDDEPGPCTHARIVRFLIQFGYGDDPRTRAGVDWLLAAQRDEEMWDCHPSRRYGCLRATHDALRVAALDAEAAAHPAVQRGAEVVIDLLLQRGMSQYHTGFSWTILDYPYFDMSLVSTLDALARLGYPRTHPQIGKALDHLLSRQLPSGAWSLDRVPYRLPLDLGRPGEPNKWLTLDALKVIKLLHGP
ncbi:MAG: hypothetical protein PVH17_06530 [Anaerolineae bacterium]|jgi:hypothetical protein